jgi:glycosyltransferase involved in cell wall biosynthesis
MSSGPLVSVIIPTRNYARFLREAIESVLLQDWTEREVIVVDDASDDETPVIVAGFGEAVRGIRREKCGGISGARNTGLSHALGELICFLDSDDVWLPGALASLVGALVESPTAQVARGNMANVQDAEMAAMVANPEQAAPRAVPGWQAGAMIFRRECFTTIGKFDESLPNAEMVNWVSAARDAGLQFAVVPGLQVLRRVHGNNSVLKASSLLPGYARLVRDHLQRLRAAGGTLQPGP